MFKQAIYEQLVTKLVATKLQSLDRTNFYIKENLIDKAEAAKILSSYLSEIIQLALNSITGDDSLEKQIKVANKVIKLLRDELEEEDFNENLIDVEARILAAVFSKIDAKFSDFDRFLKEITPYTRLSHSELFTGNNAGISLESELRKEILSSDKINFLVSFIKWSGMGLN